MADVSTHGPSDHPPGDLLDRAVAAMRQPVTLSWGFDAALRGRLLDEAAPRPVGARRAAGVGGRGGSIWGWLVRPLEIRVRPLALVGAVAAVALAAIWLAANGPRTSSPLAVRTPAPSATVEVRLVLVAPGARRVSVLGDFNDWNADATPLAQTPGASGTWATSVRLEPGRHVYAFMVDGSRWVVDPTAPRSLDDDFGRPSAVLTVAAGTI